MLSKNIRYLRKSKNMSQNFVADKLGYKSYTTIQKWESGVSEPSLSKLHELANLFNVSVDDLVSKDIEYEDSGLGNADFIKSYKYKLIPVVGSIPAGFATEAIEDIVDTVDIPAEWTRGDQEFIGLKVNGNSMYPVFLDGDTVIIKVQPTAETGDVCACYINGYDATLKRVYINETSITLKPENPEYPPSTYPLNGEVTIVGKVVEVRRSV